MGIMHIHVWSLDGGFLVLC